MATSFKSSDFLKDKKLASATFLRGQRRGRPYLEVRAAGEGGLVEAVDDEDHPGVRILHLEDVVLLDGADPEREKGGVKRDGRGRRGRAGLHLNTPLLRMILVNVSGRSGRGPTRSPVGSKLTRRGPS